MKTMKTMMSVLALSAIAGTAAAADFTVLDANADGQVDFAEYKIHAVKEGKTTTLAAQEFTRMAQGDAILTQDEYSLAAVLVDQPYALQNNNVVSEPMPFTPAEMVEPVRTFEEVPQAVEAYEPPVTDAPVTESDTDVDIATDIDGTITAPDPIVTETPLESDSAVAGEVTTSDDMLDTPIEEGTEDLSDDEMLDDDLAEPDAMESDDDIETDLEPESDLGDDID